MGAEALDAKALVRVRLLAAAAAVLLIVWWSIYLLLLSLDIRTTPPDPLYTLVLIALMAAFIGLTAGERPKWDVES